MVPIGGGVSEIKRVLECTNKDKMVIAWDYVITKFHPKNKGELAFKCLCSASLKSLHVDEMDLESYSVVLFSVCTFLFDGVLGLLESFETG